MLIEIKTDLLSFSWWRGLGGECPTSYNLMVHESDCTVTTKANILAAARKHVIVSP